MKTLTFLSIFALTFNANAMDLRVTNEVIKGLNIDQQYNCVVKKVHNQPDDLSGGKHNIKPGTKLLKRVGNSRTTVSIRDLAMDAYMNVGGYDIWHYEPLGRHVKREKLCKGPCLLFFTRRGGRWVIYPQRDGTMRADYDITMSPDLRDGKKTFTFKCSKASRR